MRAKKLGLTEKPPYDALPGVREKYSRLPKSYFLGENVDDCGFLMEIVAAAGLTRGGRNIPGCVKSCFLVERVDDCGFLAEIVAAVYDALPETKAKK
ncbi:MAG: hypothetical protein NC299_04985 [Lachnospiraceae bacterium]|nr:hypothetical protein [Ruminococcus sp.]MCM1274705.1 hypothetical protein [Lachnospiraceae bacterium]